MLALDLRQLAAERFDGLRPVVCANLPYNVTTPLITAFLTAGCFDTVTVMIQREAAHRLCARPGTADYGLLTVLTAWYAELELLFDVPPHCFVPAPKVTSTVVRLRMRSAPPADVQDEALLFAIVRAAFSQRRKTLINALAAGVPGCDKARAAAAVAACGLDARVRRSVDITRTNQGVPSRDALIFCGYSFNIVYITNIVGGSSCIPPAARAYCGSKRSRRGAPCHMRTKRPCRSAGRTRSRSTSAAI